VRLAKNIHRVAKDFDFGTGCTLSTISPVNFRNFAVLEGGKRVFEKSCQFQLHRICYKASPQLSGSWSDHILYSTI
jgi:hypothetical protein